MKNGDIFHADRLRQILTEAEPHEVLCELESGEIVYWSVDDSDDGIPKGIFSGSLRELYLSHPIYGNMGIQRTDDGDYEFRGY